jgi:archaellum component FlaC
MAISRDSSKSESITVRIPKELIEKSRSIVGGGNTKAVLTALRLLCGEPAPISDTVPNAVIQEITERIEALENTVSNTVIQEITDRITALEAVSNSVLQEITERITALEGEINSLKGALPRSELSGTREAGAVYDRESLEKINVYQLRKLYAALIPFQSRSIAPNRVTKSQAIEAILDYQNKAEKNDR